MPINNRRAKIDLLAKRCLDVFISAVALTLLSPIFVVAAIGIKLKSPGSILFVADRVGLNGQTFSMFKFRTMHAGTDGQSAITAPADKRIFSFGLVLRSLKIDELPQFWNILIGDMSLVGPRPEDPMIVKKAYSDWMNETLLVRPGVTSPGAVFGYIFGESLLNDADPEGSYINQLLTPKLALERAYLERATFRSDLGYILLTVWAIFAHVFHFRIKMPKDDIVTARRWSKQNFEVGKAFETIDLGQ